ncbi:hypothetical protein ACR03S_17135 (plasmid) [Limimaricola variabilis]
MLPPPRNSLPHLQSWFDRLDAMPRVQAALQLPDPRPSAFGLRSG